MIPSSMVLPVTWGRVTIRVTTPDDDLDAVHAGDRFWVSAQAFWDLVDARPPGVEALNVVAELDGSPVGHAILVGMAAMHGGYAISRVFVRPALRRQGVGGALVTVVADAAERWKLPGLADHVGEDDPGSLAAAQRLGYAVLVRHRESELDLVALDADVVSRAVDAAVAAGFSLRPLAADADEKDWVTAHEVLVETWRDAPDSEGASAGMPLSIFRQVVRDPGRVLLAWRGDQPVGITCVGDHAETDTVNTVLTGVRREARGLGLSTAMKARHAALLAAAGVRRIVTQNASGNQPILASNHRLGFTARPGALTVGLAVDPSD